MKISKGMLGLFCLTIIAATTITLYLRGDTRHRATSTVTDWSAAVPSNLSTFDCQIGWVKMVIYRDSVEYVPDTASNGDITKRRTTVTDTFYLLRSVDKKLPQLDSAGRPVLDPVTHLPYFYASWDNPIRASKEFIAPIKRIPDAILPQMYSAIPKPRSDTIHRATDTARKK